MKIEMTNDQTSFVKAFIKNCNIADSTLKNCNFTHATIFKTGMENTELVKVNLTRSNWIQSNFSHLKIQEGKLSEASFLHSSVRESQLIDCDLKDALLLDAKAGFSIQGGVPHQITKPIIAIGWDFEHRGEFEQMTTEILRENNMLVLPYSNSTGRHAADQALLFSEMEAQYKTIALKDQSISQQLLENTIKSSQIDQLKKDAAEILKYADGFIVPGGADIVPSLYKSSQFPKFDFRSLLEIALLAEANQRKIPTMGICRGAQMINVFFGGTLLEDVKNQHGFHQLEWTTAPMGEQLRQKLGSNFKAESNHHQAVDKVGQGLQIVLQRENIPKMLLSEDGTFIASQIHPEIYTELKEGLQESKLFDDKLIEQMQNTSTSEIMEIYNTVFEEVQKKLQEQYPQHVFLNRQIELLKEGILEHADSTIGALSSMFANRNIYLFFFEKVQSFKASQDLLLKDPGDCQDAVCEGKIVPACDGKPNASF
jgi:putative glutamine amidotransferase